MSGAEATGGETKRRALLVGAFRSIVPEGGDSPFGSQGGFVDTLAPTPYSLANAYLAVFAEADPDVAARWDIETLDLAEPLELEDEREEVRFVGADLDAILARSPDLVAFSTYCWNLDTVRESVAELKRRRPDLVAIIGGRGTEGDPEGLLAETPAIDAAIVGEGELPFREILRRGGRTFAGISGVVYRDGGAVTSGGPPVAVRDLDTIPSPFLLGRLDPPPHALMMELSRGCLHACGYCTWNADKRLRHFGPARIEAELRWAHARGHRHVTLTDSAINYGTDELVGLVAAIRRADPDGDIRFTYNIRHDRLDARQLAALRELPTHMVLLGIETLGVPGMSEVDRAPVALDEVRAALASVARATRPPVASIVLGLPGDTEEDFRTSLDTLLAWTRPAADGIADVGTVLVSLLQVYRGSKLWLRREELGLRFQEVGIPYLLESPTWPAPVLARAKAYLLERMHRHPHTLKAAEAIVLMEERGGLDPRFTRRRVEALLRPWRVGMTLEGWTLEKVGVLRDTGQGVTLRVRWEAGGGYRVRLLRPTDGGPPPDVAGYAIDLRSLAGPRPPEAARQMLLRLVRSALERGARALAARRAERDATRS